MPDSATTPCCAAILADGGDVFAQESCLSFRPYRFSERSLSQREWRGSVWARETSRGSLTGAFHVTSKQSSENTRKGATLQQSSQRGRSEERRVGKAGVSTCSSRWSPYP